MESSPTRICVGCRRAHPRDRMIRLTKESETGEVIVNSPKQIVFGRSAYLCADSSCFEKTQKKNRLRNALAGRPAKKSGKERSLIWPPAPQVIKAITDLCSDSDKTCQNTQG